MVKIRASTRAILPQSRDIDDDLERQSPRIPSPCYIQPRHRKLEQVSIDLLGVIKDSASLWPELSKRDYSLPTHAYHAQTAQHSLSTKTKKLITPDPTCRDAGVFDNSKATGINSEVTDQEEGWIAAHAQTEDHEKRKKELSEILEPAFGFDHPDSSTIFLCWGKENRCHIVPIQIPNSADDEAKWQEIRRVWYIHRWDWRKWLKLFGVKGVHIVEVGRS